MNTNKNKPTTIDNQDDWKIYLQTSLDMMSTREDNFNSDLWVLATAQGELPIDFEKIRARLSKIESITSEEITKTIDMVKLLLIESTVSFKNKNLIRTT